ncbi:hypothetical protein ACLD9I_006377 [Pseudomonas aeruginosa]
MLIGIHIGLPWWLMDSMAVSVVEKERAGMATGIFNCVRVSADDVAIPVAGALLVFLIQVGSLGALPASDPGAVIEVANRAILDEIVRADTALPDERELLLATYNAAFRRLLYVLAAASALTTLLALALLGRPYVHDEAKDTLSRLAAWPARRPASSSIAPMRVFSGRADSPSVSSLRWGLRRASRAKLGKARNLARQAYARFRRNMVARRAISRSYLRPRVPDSRSNGVCDLAGSQHTRHHWQADTVLPLRALVLLAKQVASIDRMSAGRLQVGYSTGNRAREYPPLAQYYNNWAERYRGAHVLLHSAIESP